MVAFTRQLEAKNGRVPLKLRRALRLRKRNRTQKGNTDFRTYISDPFSVPYGSGIVGATFIDVSQSTRFDSFDSEGLRELAASPLQGRLAPGRPAVAAGTRHVAPRSHCLRRLATGSANPRPPAVAAIFGPCGEATGVGSHRPPTRPPSPPPLRGPPAVRKADEGARRAPGWGGSSQVRLRLPDIAQDCPRLPRCASQPGSHQVTGGPLQRWLTSRLRRDFPQ